MIAPGNHLDLGQHRTMGTAGFGGSFAPIVQYEKWEIHPVFPHFSYFRLCQNLSPNLLAPLCGAALDSLRAAPPARYRSVVRQIGIWRTVRTCHCEPARTLVWQSPSNSVLFIVIQNARFVPFSGIRPREMVLLSGRLPRQFENWLAMTGNSENPSLSNHRTIPSGAGQKRPHISGARLGRPPCGQIPNLPHCYVQLSIL